MEIKKTTNYKQFKFLTCNRETDKKHVENLMEAIQRKNMLPICPILCDSDFMVFDGQHRLEAAERLALPVYYVADDLLTDQDLISLNNLKKEWRNIDYINFHTIKKQPGFHVLSQFIAEYPWLTLSTILELLSPTGLRNTAAMKRGIVDVSNADKAKDLIFYLAIISNHTPLYRNSKFIRALRRAMQNKSFNRDQFVTNLVSYKLEKQASEIDFLEAIEAMHNVEGKSKTKLV